MIERLEQIKVDAHRHQPHTVETDAHVGVDVLDGVLTHHHHTRHAAGDAALHFHEAVPATDGVLLAPRLGRLDLERSVAGDGVVQGDDGGQHLFDRQHAVAEALVVVHQIEVTLALLQHIKDAHAERKRLREGAGHELSGLNDVTLGLDLPVRRHTAGVVVVPDVERRHLMQLDPRIEDGVRLTAEHLNVVAEVDQRLGKVAGVHALAADVGLAPVCQVSEA